MALLRSLGSSVPRRAILLKETLLQLSEDLDLPELTVYIFGSRRHKTGSVRSDIDLLFITGRRLTSEDAQRIWDAEPYLDVFQATGGTADSLVNDSRLVADSRDNLVALVDAVPLFVNGAWQDTADAYDLQEVLADRAPAATVIPLYDLYDAVPAERADILVVTALTEEYDAVLKALKTGGEVTKLSERIDPHRTTRINVGEWQVTVRNLDEMGSVGAALKTRDAILRTKASHVVLVGICAGIPRKVQLGDVIVPRTILYFESAKIANAGEQQADDQRQCDEAVRTATSLRAFKIRKRRIRVHAKDGVMACGEKVIASKKFRKRIQARHRKIVAIDMESYGVARAAAEANRRLTVIKGVCDVANKHKDDKFHRIAARNAAHVLLHLIQSGGFKSESQQQTHYSRQTTHRPSHQ